MNKLYSIHTFMKTISMLLSSLTAAFFIRMNMWKQPYFTLADEWIKIVLLILSSFSFSLFISKYFGIFGWYYD